MARLMGRIEYHITHRKLVKAMQAAAWKYVADPDADEKIKAELQEALQMGIDRRKHKKQRLMKCALEIVACVTVIYIVCEISSW